MRSIVLFICMLLSGMTSNATSCTGGEKAEMDRSNQYLHEVDFDVYRSESSFDVSIRLPMTMEYSDLTSLTLVRLGVDGEEYHFIMPLNATSKDGRMFAWYMISRELSGSNVIEAIYGAPCGISIRYKLDYENESLEWVAIQ